MRSHCISSLLGQTMMEDKYKKRNVCVYIYTHTYMTGSLCYTTTIEVWVFTRRGEGAIPVGKDSVSGGRGKHCICCTSKAQEERCCHYPGTKF